MKISTEAPSDAEDKRHRVYVALTNRCNYACPSCSTHSTPERTSLLPPEALAACLPADGTFDVQLEGGEPTLHPDFDEIVAATRQHPRVRRLTVCTNGALLPEDRGELRAWAARLGVPMTLKLSVTSYLLERDPRLLERALAARDAIAELGGDRKLVLDVRVSSPPTRADEALLRKVEEAGLSVLANVRAVRRGATASHAAESEPLPPGIVVTLVNPDGRIFGPELSERAAAMRDLV